MADAKDEKKTKPGKPEAGRADAEPQSGFQPSPRALGAAVLLMLALGVIVGSATKPFAHNVGANTILVESPAPPAEEEAAPEPTSAEPETAGGGDEAAAPLATPSAIPLEAPIAEETAATEPEPPAVPVEEELPTGLPEVKHVFLVVLGPASYEATFGQTSTSPLLKETLPAQGEVLSNYYAVTNGPLANQIALLSGQGPTPATAAGCSTYGDVLPGTENPEGQVTGDGCVYPATTKTLTGQLTEAHLPWKAYREGAEGCPNPPPDATNPFLSFPATLEDPKPPASLVGLPQLATDPAPPADKFPALAYLSPGPETPADKFLELVIPQIKESLAYKDGGMIAITASQSPQTPEAPDTSSCCISPAFPNLPAPPAEAPATGPVKPTGGGGRVGLLLLSPFVEPGTTSETYFNHFSLLATIEELFSLEKIGYAAEPAITGFDESIFNAAE